MKRWADRYLIISALTLLSVSCVRTDEGKDHANSGFPEVSSKEAALIEYDERRIPPPWKIESAAEGKLTYSIAASEIGLPIPSKKRAFREQTHVDVTLNWPPTIDNTQMLIATPERIRANLKSGRFAKIVAPWPNNKLSVPWSAYTAGPETVYLTADYSWQCRDRSAGSAPNPFITCMSVDTSLGYAAAVSIPAIGARDLPSIIDKIESSIVGSRVTIHSESAGES